MKKILCCLSILILIVCVSGCSIGGGSNDGPGDDFNLNVEDPSTLSGDVKIALPSSGGKREILTTVIEEYEKARPNVNVEVEWKTSDDFYLSYQIDVSTGLVYPDAAFIDHVYIQSLASLDLIYPVDGAIKDVEDLYIENLTAATMLDGKNYGFPMSANTMALFYNKDILGDLPVPTTYEEFLTVGQQIYDNEAKKPADQRNSVFSLSTGADYKNFGALLFTSWVGRLGGSLLSDDLKTSKLDSQEVIEVLGMWKDLCERGWANPALSNEGLFYLGKVAFLEMGCWVVPQLFGEDANGNYGVAPVFKLTENGEASSALGLYSLCITKQSDENRMRLAADLCKYISTNTQVQVAYAKDSKCLPVTKEAANDEYFQTPVWKVFIDSLPTAARRPGSPEWPTIQDSVGNMFMKVVLGRETKENAAAKADSEIQTRLDEYYG